MTYQTRCHGNIHNYIHIYKYTQFYVHSQYDRYINTTWPLAVEYRSPNTTRNSTNHTNFMYSRTQLTKIIDNIQFTRLRELIELCMLMKSFQSFQQCNLNNAQYTNDTSWSPLSNLYNTEIINTFIIQWTYIQTPPRFPGGGFPARALASFIMSVRQGMNAVVLYVPFVVKSAQTQFRDLNCI